MMVFRQNIKIGLERTGLSGNGCKDLPVTRKYCCIAVFRSENLYLALHSLII